YMNWANLALTKAQHAPDQPSGCRPPWAIVAQTDRSGPVHAASMKAHRITGGRNQATNSRPTTVRTESSGVANRLVRTHLTMPRSRAGADRGGSNCVRTKDML